MWFPDSAPLGCSLQCDVARTCERHPWSIPKKSQNRSGASSLGSAGLSFESREVPVQPPERVTR